MLVDTINNKLWTNQEIKEVKEQLRNDSLCYCSVIIFAKFIRILERILVLRECSIFDDETLFFGREDYF